MASHSVYLLYVSAKRAIEVEGGGGRILYLSTRCSQDFVRGGGGRDPPAKPNCYWSFLLVFVSLKV